MSRALAPRTSWRRKEADKVTADEHRAVINRDRVCFLWRIDRGHVCRDPWGAIHPPDDVLRLTLDHVKRHARIGKRADPAPGFSKITVLVAMCHAGNVGVPSATVRQKEREYLADLYPAAWAA